MGSTQSLYLATSQGRQHLDPEIPPPAVLGYRHFSVMLRFTIFAYCNFCKFINLS